MNKRQRMCEKRGAEHYKGRTVDVTKEWGPIHTCLTPEDYRWNLYCDWHRQMFGFIPDRPLEGETGQQYLSELPDYDGTVPPPSLAGRRLPDGRWECQQPKKMPYIAPQTDDEFDPYA